MTIQKREESLIKKVNNLDNEIKKEVDKLGKDFNLGNITKEEYKKQIRRCKSKEKTENKKVGEETNLQSILKVKIRKQVKLDYF